ncbi:MAG: hypothetical protein ABFD15_06060 [Methanofastidiosum sp.]
MKDIKKVEEWLETLNEKQIKKVALITIERLIETEEIRILDSKEGPYWECCGDTILEE